MTARRSKGDGGLHWDEQRQRWIASVTLGYSPAGKRIVKKASGKTKTEAKAKLKEIIRDHEDGLTIAPTNYTVSDAVTYWLAHGLGGRSPSTVRMYTTFAETHVLPALGARKLRDLSVEDVDSWLASKKGELSTRSLKLIHGILNRAVKSAMRRDKVKRNVVDLCEIPEGRAGRPSKALTLAQAQAILDETAKATPRMRAYIVLSLLIGARTEELRALTWSHVVAYDEERQAWLPVAEAGWDHEEFAIHVWRSVRQKGDTKTVKSRRSLKLPRLCVDALHALADERTSTESDLVFRTKNGTALTAHNVRPTSARSSTTPTSPARTGPHARCGTASSRCCRTPAFRSRTSPASSAIGTPWSPRPSTASRSARCSRRARRRWTASSRHSHSDGH
ncbi:tyrosine-type recombinase/integrase [Sphaerimonospora mesophila]|uniref:tyrosine-type recombinase/integrase n=1 Tax=Sphaerimonospora mesophila TaxID=37483 RepID=UPI000AA50B3A